MDKSEYKLDASIGINCDVISYCTNDYYFTGESKISFKKLWEELGDIPVNDMGEIEKPFLHFEEGSDREDIWTWFEEKFNVTLGEIM